MTSKQELQALNDAAQHQIEQARAIQNALKRLNTLKKDSELKQQQQALLQLLQNLSGDVRDFQHKAAVVQYDLESVLGASGGETDNPQNSDRSQNQQNAQGDGKKRLPDPDDQESTYQLKAVMMPKIYSQNKNLEAEIILRNRRNDLRSQRQHRQINYNTLSNLSVQTTLHVINSHERKAREAEAKAKSLQADLDQLKGKQPAYRQGTQSADGDRSQSMLGPNNRVNDVIKKNEHLLEENQEQQKEIQRLKRENAELIKKAKNAEQNRHQILTQLSTSEMARKDLSIRLQRQKAQHDRLSRSLTRQSSDWIESKKQETQEEEEYRWKNVGHAAPHGSYERTFSHPQPRNVDQPRYMFPVQNYAQLTAA